jgi:hypothetical protein
MNDEVFIGAVNGKLQAAVALLRGCISPVGKGIWAARDRYDHQCWTRDMALAAAPTFRLLGWNAPVVNHLRELTARISKDGKVPILYLDDEVSFLRAKIEKSIATGKMSFMLERYLASGLSVENLTSWTTDGELLYVIAAFEQHGDALNNEKRLGDPEIAGLRDMITRAQTFMRGEHVRGRYFVGGDWRDTQSHLRDKALLTNNALLYRHYTLAWTEREAEELKEDINRDFWTGTHYRDHLGTDTTDTFGTALAVLCGIVPEERYDAVVASFERLNTPFGYMTNDCPPNPTTEEERELLSTMPQSMVVWPFIHGFAILALLKMGRRRLAEEGFKKYTALDGFYEWYDPSTGKGYGAKDQLWSAALYLRAAKAYGLELPTIEL